MLKYPLEEMDLAVSAVVRLGGVEAAELEVAVSRVGPAAEAEVWAALAARLHPGEVFRHPRGRRLGAGQDRGERLGSDVAGREVAVARVVEAGQLGREQEHPPVGGDRRDRVERAGK